MLLLFNLACKVKWLAECDLETLDETLLRGEERIETDIGDCVEFARV